MAKASIQATQRKERQREDNLRYWLHLFYIDDGEGGEGQQKSLLLLMSSLQSSMFGLHEHKEEN